MNNPYIPKAIRISRISLETPGIKTFSLKYPLKYIPGQFLEVSCFGIGEAPISISSCPGEGLLQISFKRIGSVTEGLFGLKKNDSIGIRGPLGKGFPLEQLEGNDLILIAGGVGMAPLRSLLKFVLSKKRGTFGDIVLLYGSRTPQDMLYKGELEDWAKHIKVICTVDKASGKWKGRVGVVPELLDEIKTDPVTAKAIVCGPPIMMHFTAAKLLRWGMKPSAIILSLERYMKCGVGKCGHCYVADKFICRDGPIFTYEELNNLVPQEALR